MSKRPFGEIGFSASSGVKLNANSSVVTDSFGDITTTPQGVSGQVLTSQGSGAPPKYTNIDVNLANVSGVLDTAHGGTGATVASGNGNAILQTSPLVITPTIQTPQITNLANTGYIGNPAVVPVLVDVNTGIVTASAKTGSGFAVFSDTPTLTNPVISGPTTNLTGLTSSTTPDANLTLESGVLKYTPVTGTGSAVHAIAPNISQCQLSGLASSATPSLVLTQQGSDVVTATVLTGSGSIVAQNSPALTGTPNIAAATGSTITATTKMVVATTSGSPAEASIKFDNSATTNKWVVGTNTNGATGGFLNFFSSTPNANIFSVSPTGLCAATDGFQGQNATPSTFAKFDGTRTLVSAAKTGTSEVVVSDTAPSVSNATLTGTTTADNINTGGLAVVKAGQTESSMSFQNSGSNWITGLALGGEATDKFFWYYNGVLRASMDTAGVFIPAALKPVNVGNNSVMYTDSTGVIQPVSGSLGNAGQALISNGPTTPPTWQAQAASAYTAGAYPTTTTYMVPGDYSYTPPTGVKYVSMTVFGGGGAGGRYAPLGSNQGGGGGASAGFVKAIAPATYFTGGTNVTVGRAGVGHLPPGSVALTNSSAFVTGTNTQFLSTFSAGDAIDINSGFLIATVAFVFSDTSLTITAPYFGAPLSNLPYTDKPVGTILSATAGAPVVLGSGTKWRKSLADGGWIVFGPTQTIQQILTVDSDTQITLVNGASDNWGPSGVWARESQPGTFSSVKVVNVNNFFMIGTGGGAGFPALPARPGGGGIPTQGQIVSGGPIYPAGYVKQLGWGNTGSPAPTGVIGEAPAHGGVSPLGGGGGSTSWAGGITLLMQPSFTASGGAGAISTGTLAAPYPTISGQYGGVGYVQFEEFYN